MSLFGALRLGGAAIEASRLALQVTGNNIANAGTAGFVREEAKLVPVVPTRFGNLAIGNGVSVAGIQRKIDVYLNERARQANSEFEAANARSTFLQRVENIFNELGDQDLSTVFSDFYQSIQDVQNDPSNVALRSLAVRRGEVVADMIRSIRSRLDDLSRDISQEVRLTANEINQSLRAVNELNGQIGAIEAGGTSEASSLRTARDQELAKIGSKIDIRVIEQPNGGVAIYTKDGSQPLLFGGLIQEVGTQRTAVDGVLVDNLIVQSSGYPVPTTGGRLGGAQTARDVDIASINDALDSLASNFIFEFNKLFSSGQGLKNFTNVTSADRVLDPNAALNSAAANLNFIPNNGAFELRITNRNTDLVQTALINVDLDGIGAEDSLNSIVAKINAAFGSGAASVTAPGNLQIVAPPDVEFSFANDTSGFLAAMGINTFFTGKDSHDIGVNGVLKSDASFFTASKSGTPGDVSNAIALASFQDKALAGLGGLSMNQFYTGLIADLGSMSQEARVSASISDATRQALDAESLSISGVSLDEETINLLSFQRSFQASARYISTINELLDEVINLGR